MGRCVLCGDVLCAAILRAPVGGGAGVGCGRAVVDAAAGVGVIFGGGDSGIVVGESGRANLGRVWASGSGGVWEIVLGGRGVGVCQHYSVDDFDVWLASFRSGTFGAAWSARGEVCGVLGSDVF